MRNVRTIIVLLAAVIVCLTVLRLADAPQWSRRAGGTARGTRLFADGFMQIDSLAIERGGLRMDLQRVDTRWTLTQPLATGADAAMVMRFLDQLERAPLWDQLSVHDLRRRQLTMSDFGLAPPTARVVVRGPLYRVEIAFGTNTPAGNGVYAALDSTHDVVWVTDRQLLDALPTSIEQWRDRSLLGERGGKGVVLEVRRPGVPFIKVVRTGDAWQLVQPFTGRASEQAVAAALTALYAARVEHYIVAGGTNGVESALVDARARLAFYGLDTDSAVQVQLWEKGNPAGARVRFGRPVEAFPGLVYALTPGDDSVVAVSNSVLQALPAGVDALRDHRLFVGSSAALRRLNIQFADETVTLEVRKSTEGDTWRMTAPISTGVDTPTVKQLVASLMALQAARLLDPVEPPAAGVEPLCRIEAVFAGGVTQRVVVSRSVDAAADYNLVTAASPTVFVVAASNMPPQLTRKTGVLDLAERTMLALPAPSIRRVTVKGPDRQEVVERKGTAGNEQWVTAEGTANTAALRAWATLLGNWRAARVVRLGAGAQDVAAFGMDEPLLEITVDVDSDAAVRQTVLIGRPAANGGRYAAVRGHDVIYEISAETVALLERRLVDE